MAETIRFNRSRSADIGISVDSAVDIAKEAADIILLEKSLMVLEEGVLEAPDGHRFRAAACHDGVDVHRVDLAREPGAGGDVSKQSDGN